MDVPMLHFKNGVSFPDPSPEIAKAVERLHKNDEPWRVRVSQVPALTDRLNQLKQREADCERTIMSCTSEQSMFKNKLELVNKAIEALEALPPSGVRDAQLQKADRKVQDFLYQLAELDRRITMAQRLAKSTRTDIDNFEKDNPGYTEALALSKQLDVPRIF